jgi:hypothetical protein
MDTGLLIALTLASVVSIGLLFLPAIVELRKPRDSGPRLIDGIAQQNFASNTKLSEQPKEEPVDCQLATPEDNPCIPKETA